MKVPYEPAADELELVDVLDALADSTRLEVVATLADGDSHRCTDVAVSAELHKSTMSHHYRVLREAGVTHTAIEGRDRWVSLRRADLDTAFPGLLDSVLTSAATRRTRGKGAGS